MPDKDPEITQQMQLAELLPSSIEVQKNSRGYTWTLKLRCEVGKEDELIDRMKTLNDKMKVAFPPE